MQKENKNTQKQNTENHSIFFLTNIHLFIVSLKPNHMDHFRFDSDVFTNIHL